MIKFQKQLLFLTAIKANILFVDLKAKGSVLKE